jgi:hypothetical protein
MQNQLLPSIGERGWMWSVAAFALGLLIKMVEGSR